MPKVPERPLSYGEKLNIERKSKGEKIILNESKQEKEDKLYWRYKKGVAPTSNSLTHPYKCSKCEYIAKDLRDSKRHWLDH